jgi:hypothetical protein
MTLQDVSNLSQAVAAVAVLASLVFVGIQMRMSAEQQRQANVLARIEIGGQATRHFRDHVSRLTDHDLATIFRKVMFERADLSPTETTQILTYFNLCVGEHWQAHQALEHGLIDKANIEALEHNMAWYLTAPLFAKEWRRGQRLGLFPASFVEHVNKRVAELYPGHAALSQLQAQKSGNDQAVG